VEDKISRRGIIPSLAPFKEENLINNLEIIKWLPNQPKIT
jgi:hypothetical protein